MFNKYENNLLTTTISYSHTDSSEPGYLSIDTLHRKYDAHGRLAIELHVYGIASKSINVDTTGHYKRILDYTASGDTIIRYQENSFQQDTSQTTDISQWEHDDKRRVIRFYRLYVLKGNRDSRPDTSMHFSKRFAYDKHGRLKMAWFDSMYLGNSYMLSGPDTTLYRYDSQNRLVEEKQRYTTSLHNKREMDTTGVPNRLNSWTSLWPQTRNRYGIRND